MPELSIFWDREIQAWVVVDRDGNEVGHFDSLHDAETYCIEGDSDD